MGKEKRCRSLQQIYVRSVAASYVKIKEKLFELLDNFVDKIGESNIVQLVTDNGNNYVLARKYYS